MKLTIHEVAQVIGAKNDVSIFEDAQLENSRLIGTGMTQFPKVHVMVDLYQNSFLKMVQQYLVRERGCNSSLHF